MLLEMYEGIAQSVWNKKEMAVNERLIGVEVCRSAIEALREYGTESVSIKRLACHRLV